MEELRNSCVVLSEAAKDPRKPYEAPSAEVIKLVPEERLALGDTGFHSDNAGNRWALGKWGDYGLLKDNSASAVIGYLAPDEWSLPGE